MYSTNRSAKAPETDLDIVMGYPGFSVKELRRNRRLRHMRERIVPSARRESTHYHNQNLINLERLSHDASGFLMQGIGKHVEMTPGEEIEIFRRGERPSTKFPRFAFSNVTAYAKELEPAPEQARVRQMQWIFFIANHYNETVNVLTSKTSLLPDHSSTAVNGYQGRIDDVAAIDLQNGRAFGPEDYDLEGRTHLYGTLAHTFDLLDSALWLEQPGISITKL